MTVPNMPEGIVERTVDEVIPLLIDGPDGPRYPEGVARAVLTMLFSRADSITFEGHRVLKVMIRL